MRQCGQNQILNKLLSQDFKPGFVMLTFCTWKFSYFFPLRGLSKQRISWGMTVTGSRSYFCLELEEFAEVTQEKMNIIFLNWDRQGEVESVLKRGIILNRDMQAHNFLGDLQSTYFEWKFTVKLSRVFTEFIGCNLNDINGFNNGK